MKILHLSHIDYELDFQASKEWRYSAAKECLDVQPAARDGLLHRETHTRIYKLYISKYVSQNK